MAIVHNRSLVLEGPNGAKQYVKFKEGNKIISNASIEQIDVMTSSCKDFEDFLNKLKKSVELDFIPKKMYMEYKSKGEIVKDFDIIYNDMEFCKNAYQVLHKKATKQKNTRLDPNNKEILELYKKIMRHANSGKSIGSFPYILKNRILNYLSARDSNLNSLHGELDDFRNDIYYCLTDYKVYRDIKVYFNKLEAKELKNKPQQEDYTQIKLDDYFDMESYNQFIKEKDELVKGLEEYIDEHYQKDIPKDELLIGDEVSFIEDDYLREIFIECNGDVTSIISLLGEDKVNSLSDGDKYILGIPLNEEYDEEYWNPRKK